MVSLRPVFDRLAAMASASHARACAFLLLLSLAAFLPGFATLQPLDRDEPRFAQASKQMLETGDFVDIRFQQEAGTRSRSASTGCRVRRSRPGRRWASPRRAGRSGCTAFRR
jgi:hypothetical protein